MKLIHGSLCFAAATLAVIPLSLHAQPRAQLQFQTLTPGASSTNASWVRHLNRMNEEERQRRVRTYGMPPAPPNRWTQPGATARPAPRISPAPAPPSTTGADGLPRSLYQRRTPARAPQVTPARRIERPRVINATVKRPVSQPATARRTTLPPRPRFAGPAAESRRRSAMAPLAPRASKPQPRVTVTKKKAESSATPRLPALRLRNPFAAKSRATKEIRPISQPTQTRRFTEKKTPALPKFTFKNPFSRPAPEDKVTPVLFNPKPITKPRPKPTTTSPSTPKIMNETARREREASVRRQLAFTPKSQSSGRSANPWAPYTSRSDYERAVSRTQWQPRGPHADELEKKAAPSPKKAKRRWGLSSLFKRRPASSQKDERRKLSGTAKKTRLPNSRYVTSGLPQSDRSSGGMIETTLFGR